MPFLGKQPTSIPLTTSDLADDIISLAKMAGGTDGNIITYDASGNPAVVATGNDGQVLTSTGAGSPPAFETLSSTIDHFRVKKTSTVNPSNNTMVKVTFQTEEYDTTSEFDLSNDKFIPANGDIWWLTAQLNISGESHDLQAARCRLTKNGSSIHDVYCDTWDVDSNIMSPILNHIITGNGSDYYEVYGLAYKPSGTPEIQSNSYFQGIKLA